MKCKNCGSSYCKKKDDIKDLIAVTAHVFTKDAGGYCD